MCGCTNRKKLELRKRGSRKESAPLCKEIYPKLGELEIEISKRLKDDSRNNTLKQYKLIINKYRRNIHKECPREDVILEIETYLN